jgi:bacillithiol system protein YtxJ
MNWNLLKEVSQLESIDKESESSFVLILKHSTTCSISAMALSRLERKWLDSDVTKAKPYYLDLLSYRNISNEIEKRYQVEHQSPQVLIIKNAKCIFSETHSSIRYEDIMELVSVD